MLRSGWGLLALTTLCVTTCLCVKDRSLAPPGIVHAAPRSAAVPLHLTRQSPSDLELGGSLAGVPAGQTRFVSFADLSSLPQETDTVTDDAGLGKSVRITGIALEKLPALLGAPGDNMITALCGDAYAAHYPAAYLRAHHPVLVLRLDDKPSSQWRVLSSGDSMGPYLVSHPSFTPAFVVLAHADERQVPWGVIRLDFNAEQQVYGPIAPSGSHAHDPLVQQGYTIASQNCFRCHDRAGQGGLKARVPWNAVAGFAVANSQFFDSYVRDPQRLNPHARMEGSPQYDDATMAALRAYFTLFAETTP